eukprot:1182248-Prorocentrum_minimum.AAC.1
MVQLLSGLQNPTTLAFPSAALLARCPPLWPPPREGLSRPPPSRWPTLPSHVPSVRPSRRAKQGVVGGARAGDLRDAGGFPDAPHPLRDPAEAVQDGVRAHRLPHHEAAAQRAA